MESACRKALNEFDSQVVRSALNKNWRNLWYTIEKVYDTTNICQGDEDMELVISYIVLKLSKLLTGYILEDKELYAEYIVRAIFSRATIEDAFSEIKQLIEKENKEDVTAEDIKKVTLKLLSAIHNYITTPY